MKGSIENPKVFISYSWTNVQHVQWVLELAERLSGDGIVVILDKWDLKEGQDKHAFMEQMVNDKTISKVLVICDSAYQLKADNRKGGVGTETQLISKEIYEHTGQEKFIPIIREYDSSNKPCIPHYMASRIYIDFSSNEVFEVNYQKLIRNLYDKPLLEKPPLGTPPAYITAEEPKIIKTSHKVTEVKNAIFNDRKSVNGLILDYLDIVIASLKDFRLSGGSTEGFDDRVMESIEKMGSLREDFIDFIFMVFKYYEKVELEKFHDFFEKLIPFSDRPEGVQSWTRIDFDNYRFFIYELFLNFITVLLRLKKYKEAAYFIYTPYFFRDLMRDKLHYSGVEIFNHYIGSLDEIRNKRLNLRRVSVTADLIKSNSTRKDISFTEIIRTDLILYYLTELQGGDYSWFPRTSIYNSRGLRVELFDRLVSRQYFEKIKDLFNVRNIDELKKSVSEYIERRKEQTPRRSFSWNYEILPLEKVINPDNIGTIN